MVAGVAPDVKTFQESLSQGAEAPVAQYRRLEVIRVRWGTKPDHRE
jgi:hypothetical protein